MWPYSFLVSSWRRPTYRLPTDIVLLPSLSPFLSVSVSMFVCLSVYVRQVGEEVYFVGYFCMLYYDSNLDSPGKKSRQGVSSLKVCVV